MRPPLPPLPPPWVSASLASHTLPPRATPDVAGSTHTHTLHTDFGGHDNHHLKNVYAYVGQGIGFYDAPMLAGHEDHFEQNTLVLRGTKVGGFTCTGVGKTVISKNKYYTPTGNITECGKTLQAWQAAGGDPGSSVAALPTDATVIGWAKKLLGF